MSRNKRWHRCKYCDAIFYNTNQGKTYCSNECKIKYREWKYGKEGERYNAISDIIEIQRKARELHMTYGEYVARMGV